MMNIYLFGSILIVCFFFNTEEIYCQNNLILNGDFEELIKYKIKNLYIDGYHVGDEFEADTFFLFDNKRRHSQVMSHSWNYQDIESPMFNSYYSRHENAKSGFVYGEIFPFYQSGNDDFLVKNVVGELCKPLSKDNIYLLTFWAKPHKGNVYADILEAKITTDKEDVTKYFKFSTSKKHKKGSLLLKNHVKLLHDDLKMYKKYTMQLTAKGGEKYIIIGNPDFLPPRNYKKKEMIYYGLTRVSFVKPKPSCSYLIDSVSLINITNPTDSCNLVGEDFFLSVQDTLKTNYLELFSTKPERDTTLIIEIFFEEDKYELENEELAKIKSILGIEKQLKVDSIEITGFANSTGTENYNLKLSEQRAFAVQKFLKESIGDEYTINVKYEGESILKYFEKYKNRRVEISIKGKIN